jgi:hypothetical protein
VLQDVGGKVQYLKAAVNPSSALAESGGREVHVKAALDHEVVKDPRFFEGGKVLAVDVLYQGKDRVVRGPLGEHLRVDGLPPEGAGGEEAPVSGDDGKARLGLTQQDRLKLALCGEASGEFGQLFGVDAGAERGRGFGDPGHTHALVGTRHGG